MCAIQVLIVSQSQQEVNSVQGRGIQVDSYPQWMLPFDDLSSQDKPPPSNDLNVLPSQLHLERFGIQAVYKPSAHVVQQSQCEFWKTNHNLINQ